MTVTQNKPVEVIKDGCLVIYKVVIKGVIYYRVGDWNTLAREVGRAKKFTYSRNQHNAVIRSFSTWWGTYPTLRAVQPFNNCDFTEVTIQAVAITS